MQAIASIDPCCRGTTLYPTASGDSSTNRESLAYGCCSRETSSAAGEGLACSSSAALGGFQQLRLRRSSAKETSRYKGKLQAVRGQRLGRVARAEVQSADKGETAGATRMTTLCFELHARCTFGQTFHVVGEQEALGNWNLEAAVPLAWTEGDVWVGELDVPTELHLEFKYVLKGQRGEVEWQPGRNRVVDTGSTPSRVIIRKPWDEVSCRREEVVEYVHLEAARAPAEKVNAEVSGSSAADRVCAQTALQAGVDPEAVDAGVNAVELIDEAIALVSEILEIEREAEGRLLPGSVGGFRKGGAVGGMDGPASAGAGTGESPGGGSRTDLGKGLIPIRVEEGVQDDEQEAQPEAGSVETSEEVHKPLAQAADTGAPKAKGQNGAAAQNGAAVQGAQMGAGAQKAAGAKGPPEPGSGEKEKEEEEEEEGAEAPKPKGLWGRNIWANLLKSWGRKPLMDEEPEKTSR